MNARRRTPSPVKFFSRNLVLMHKTHWICTRDDSVALKTAFLLDWLCSLSSRVTSHFLNGSSYVLRPQTCGASSSAMHRRGDCDLKETTQINKWREKQSWILNSVCGVGVRLNTKEGLLEEEAEMTSEIILRNHILKCHQKHIWKLLITFPLQLTQTNLNNKVSAYFFIFFF